ncbi:MAG: aldo/keto reductase [Oscillospiraceae bacterium]|nr:aldo/keto reductase [Oscillospiraceae bacterium]
MYTKDYHGEQISVLGMGNMRLPTIGEGRTAPIDYEKAAEIIDYAMKSGITYYDTAYVYNGSEVFLGTVLPNYDRSSFKLATKYNAMASSDYKAVFEEQLQRLNTDYIDFYLMHAVMNEDSLKNYLDSGALDYFVEQKRLGRIRKLGFSSHAPIDVLEKMADAYSWDFAQIQLNYLDWTMRDAKGQYEVLTKRGIPVVVMEPVRGGRLASLSPKADAMLKEAHPDWSIASWAFRWLMRLENVQVILSGMSTMEQIMDNVKTFDHMAPLSDEDTELLEKACDLFRGEISVPCTGCRYCTDECPMEIDIPRVMEGYNKYKLDGPMSLGRMEAKPSDCIGCGACQKHCPQNIAIPEVMAELKEVISKMPPPQEAKKP